MHKIKRGDRPRPHFKQFLRMPSVQLLFVPSQRPQKRSAINSVSPRWNLHVRVDQSIKCLVDAQRCSGSFEQSELNKRCQPGAELPSSLGRNRPLTRHIAHAINMLSRLYPRARRTSAQRPALRLGHVCRETAAHCSRCCEGTRSPLRVDQLAVSRVERRERT